MAKKRAKWSSLQAFYYLKENAKAAAKDLKKTHNWSNYRIVKVADVYRIFYR